MRDLNLTVREAILRRSSTRAFKSESIPRGVLEEVLDLARRSPSWGNTQPWEVAVVSGQPLNAIREGLSAKVAAGVVMSPDLAWPQFSGQYNERQREAGRHIFEALGVGRSDTDKRQARVLAMQRFLEAPVGLVFYMDAELGHWSMLDLGLFMQTTMLSALSYGLGTCPMAAVAQHPAVLHEVLGIPASKRIICGMAVGYPEVDAPANRYRSERLAVSDFATWHGVEE